jgi:ATP/maltotriose-dependent transcriptional regulator MalT
MAPLAAHLVGRADELGAMGRLLDELEEGRAGALALVGEPGIGKTRLLHELGAHAELRGYLVLGGSASELERDLPFSVLVNALDEYVEGLDAKQFATFDDDVQAELAHVFPSLAALGRGREVAVQQERYRIHRAVRALLEQLARSRPLVLVLDDLHWADSASIELVGALLRRPPGAAVLMMLALRPSQVPERLSSALSRADREAALTRIELGALKPAEARELLGGTVPDTEATVLYEESGGNPFYLEQLARSLDRAGRAASTSAVSPIGIGVPSAVAASLSEELSQLSDHARLVLEGAAVAGDPFEPDLAAYAAATSEAAAMDAVDELLQSDLIRSTEVPRRFRFRHPLIRHAVYEASAGGWRLRAHERCAEALATRGATAAERAHHVERSAREGDVTAVAVLREAGEAAAPVAPASAAHWFGAALRLLPDRAPSEERVALLLARAGSLAATGRFTDSHADLLAGLDIAVRGAAAWRVRAATACAAIEHLLGLQEEAHRHLATALAELEDPKSAAAVELMIELAVDGFHGGDFDAMRGWAERAVAAAAPLGDRALLAAALAVRAQASAMAGDREWAPQHCDEATNLVDDLPDRVLARRLDALATLATADGYLERFPAAARHAQRALEIGRATGQADLFPLLVAVLCGTLSVQGKPLEVEALSDGAVEAARLAGNVHGLAWSLLNRGFVALVAGHLDVALATAEESVELTEEMEPGEIPALAAAVLASVLLESGQPDRSLDLLIARAGGMDLALFGGAWRARFLEVLTRALLAVGRRSDAERATAAAQACAETVALPSAHGLAGLAAAELALDAGAAPSAADRALEATAAFESAGALFDAARGRELAGRALVQAGEPEAAARQLELAAAAFESFGSRRYRDKAERELRRLGRHPQHRTHAATKGGSGLASLTERELEIARLVTDRRTNTQIAAELFLSPKTVETHLRNIFNKVGVETRVDLARAVERADRAPGTSPK